ncbi:MAG: hypothetical protein K2P79_07310 [Sphingomonas sp.]|nr:hypothetical protein [Sphingomonas sp.]
MPVTIDVLMPAVGDYYAAEAADAVADYAPAFAAAGMALAPRAWTEGPGDGAATLALFAWGYHADPARWLAMLDAWPAGNRLINPAALLRWNTTKTYLEALAAAGVPIVPSLFGDADAASVAAAYDHFGVDELVVKPQVSAGSDRTVRVRRGDALTPLANAIIQPFLPAIGDEGELSLFYIGGDFSHAARKVAAAGDFRIQPQFGGVITRIDPPAEAIAVAKHALAALPEAPCYARVDLLRLADGGLALIELEAIEPDLYPDLDDGVRDRLATAVAAVLAQ